jgi:hypothetical protein
MVPDRHTGIADFGEISFGQAAGEEVATNQQRALSGGQRLCEVVEVDDLDFPQMAFTEEPVHQQVVEEAQDGIPEVPIGDVSQAGISNVRVEPDREPLQETFSRSTQTGRAQHRSRVPESIKPADREKPGYPSGRVKVHEPRHILHPNERRRFC